MNLPAAKKLRRVGLKRILQVLVKQIQIRYYFMKAALLGLPEYQGPTRGELQQIEDALRDKGIAISDYFVDLADFGRFKKDFHFGPDFYGGERSPLFNEKVLEHFIAYDLGIRNSDKDAIYVDIAASNSPWAMLLREQGYSAFGIDLEKSRCYGDLPFYRLADATRTDFPDSSVSCASLQCAYEMFLGDSDSRLVDELARILKPGGIAIISPLYMHTHYCGYCSPSYWRCNDFHDIGAKLYVKRSSWRIPFSRKYDVEALQSRVLKRIQVNSLEYRLSVLRNAKDIDPHIYCYFFLQISKRNPGETSN